MEHEPHAEPTPFSVEKNEAPTDRPEAYVPEVDCAQLAAELEELLPDEDLDWLRAGVDEDGKPLTGEEVVAYLYGTLLAQGIDPDTVLTEIGLLPGASWSRDESPQ